jgi:hypothetical protein
MRVHVATEHPAELELADVLLHAAEVCGNVVERSFILILGRKRVEFACIVDTAPQPVQGADERVECRALLAQRLSPRLILPNAGILELALDFL